MSLKEKINRLPEPSTHEEMLIYNFVKGEEIYPTSSLVKPRDKFMEVLLLYLKENLKAKPATSSARKKAEG